MSIMTNQTWDTIKNFYGESFGFPEGLVELVSISDVLLLCVSGTSNDRIKELFKLANVKDILKEWLNFEGWGVDLDCNPYSIYAEMVNYGYYSLEDFRKEVKEQTNLLTEQGIKNAYSICSIYYRLEERLNNEWF